MSIFKCKICGGTLEINVGETVATCEYCGTKQTLPILDNEKKANLFDRANHFRRNNDFDKAMGIYEQILNEDVEDAESYWSIVLCRYGIEYVEDPSSHKRVPTVNRAQFTSIFDDEDYKSAIKYADSYQKSIYEAEATTINEIQKGILAISGQEEPFDVFICYKESDNSGARTPDSVLANELYHELTEEGFKVFFAKITLEDKLGTAYEPYIFAALHSAKVMVVLGTKPEHFNAVWVKNEWSRYLSLIKSGADKMLIPAYRDMDPYDLPEEFSHLQAQDMSKLGFMQDLVRGIKKITNQSITEHKMPTKELSSLPEISNLLKRAYAFLADEDFNKAINYFDSILDRNMECSEAYWGLVLATSCCTNEESLIKIKIKNKQYLDLDKNYQKAVRYSKDNKYEKINQEIKQYFKAECTKIETKIAEIEKEIFPLKESLNSFAEQKKRISEKKEEISREQAKEEEILSSIQEEYDKYSENKRSLLCEKDKLPIWSVKAKIDIDKKIEEIHRDMELCVNRMNLKKKEINDIYEKIWEDIICEENEILKSISHIETDINIKKSEISNLNDNKKTLLEIS